MRYFLFILAITFTTVNSNGQWYSKACDVTDFYSCTQEQYDCLWKKARINTLSSVFITGTGLALFVVATSSVNEASDGDSFADAVESVAGQVSQILGATIALTGVSVLVVGIGRVTSLKKHPLYQTAASASLRISPTLMLNSLNQSHVLGLTASLRF